MANHKFDGICQQQQQQQAQQQQPTKKFNSLRVDVKEKFPDCPTLHPSPLRHYRFLPSTSSPHPLDHGPSEGAKGLRIGGRLILFKIVCRFRMQNIVLSQYPVYCLDLFCRFFLESSSLSVCVCVCICMRMCVTSLSYRIIVCSHVPKRL